MPGNLLSLSAYGFMGKKFPRIGIFFKRQKPGHYRNGISSYTTLGNTVCLDSVMPGEHPIISL